MAAGFNIPVHSRSYYGAPSLDQQTPATCQPAYDETAFR